MQQRALGRQAAQARAQGQNAHVLHAGVGQQALVMALPHDENGRRDQREQAEKDQQAAAEIARSAASMIWCPRRMPNRAQLSSAPESRADTRDGAWLWASGSQLCRGARPILVP